jgi:hypothetical protein
MEVTLLQYAEAEGIPDIQDMCRSSTGEVGGNLVISI